MQRRRIILFLIIAAIVLLALMLFGSVKQSNLFRLSAPVTPLEDDLSTNLATTSLTQVQATNQLESPRFTGQSAQGHAWEVTAVSAHQEGSATSTTVVMNTVLAKFEYPTRTTSQTVEIRAEQGRFQQASSTLNLAGGVEVTGLGLTLTTPHLSANLTTRSLAADGETHITGPVGPWLLSVQAPHLSAEQTEGKLTLTGGVRARLTPRED